MKKESYTKKLRKFEQEKKKLFEKNLSGKEFEQEIKKLADKYGI